MVLAGDVAETGERAGVARAAGTDLSVRIGGPTLANPVMPASAVRRQQSAVPASPASEARLVARAPRPGNGIGGLRGPAIRPMAPLLVRQAARAVGIR